MLWDFVKEMISLIILYNDMYVCVFVYIQLYMCVCECVCVCVWEGVYV